MPNNLMGPPECWAKLFIPGRLEGIDGPVKTTQLTLLAKWLSAESLVFVTGWSSSNPTLSLLPANGAEDSSAQLRVFSFSRRPRRIAAAARPTRSESPRRLSSPQRRTHAARSVGVRDPRE